MRRLVSALLLITITASALAACSGTAVTESATSVMTTASSAAAPSSASRSETVYHHEFKPHVYSSMYEENFDAKTRESFFSLCDAMLAGEDEFICEDEVMYYTVVNTIAHDCFPLVRFIGGDPSFSGGKAHIMYSVSKDQYLQKAEEFRSLVNSILDECVKPEYSDTGKALAVYEYFVSHYTYDYAAAADDSIPLSSYRLLTERTGICQEIAPAYAYIMLQAGVDCSTCGALNNVNDAHEWAFIKLDGEYYHVDPTYGIEDPDTFRYFGMTDEERNAQGGWIISVFNYGNANIFDDNGRYKADSKKFEPLRTSVTCLPDYDNNRITYYRSDDSEQYEFVY